MKKTLSRLWDGVCILFVIFWLFVMYKWAIKLGILCG